MLPWINSPSPNHGSSRIATLGVIIHSTRGSADYGDEFDGTLNWFNNPLSESSAHIVLGYDGRRARCVEDGLAAWHAGSYNNYHYLSAELEQPNLGDPISDLQYAGLREQLREWSKKYDFPLVWPFIIEHKDTAQGIEAVKSDVGYPFDMQRLLEGLS